MLVERQPSLRTGCRGGVASRSPGRVPFMDFAILMRKAKPKLDRTYQFIRYGAIMTGMGISFVFGLLGRSTSCCDETEESACELVNAMILAQTNGVFRHQLDADSYGGCAGANEGRCG